MDILTIPLLTIFAAHVVSGGAPPPWSHTRAVTPLAAALIAEARRRAPTVRFQLDALDRTDVVVYVSHHLGFSPGQPQAYLRFVSSVGGRRYLAVEINCWQVGHLDRLSVLGHELQHALEIARAPEVEDATGLVQLYKRIGFQVRPREFETYAARAVGAQVRRELTARD